MIKNELAPTKQEQYFYHSVGEINMVKGSGLYLYDSEGDEYLDCASGTFNLPFGHNPTEILDAAKLQIDKLAYISSSFHCQPLDELAKILIEISPPNLTSVHLRSPGGSTANEGAIKIAQYATGKRDVISMFRGHVGQTIAMTSTSGYASRREPFPYVMPGNIHVPAAYCYRCFYNSEPSSCNFPCVSKISDFIKYGSSGSVAAIIVEPVMATGGTIVPPRGYFQALKEFCDDNNIILIFDEVQTAFGRCGEMFAADLYGVSPHIMTLSKGISGMGLPIGAILTEKRLEGLERLYHGFTGGGHIVSAAAAVKTIELLRQPGVMENVRQRGEQILNGLRELKLKHEWIGDVRGTGLMIGLECVFGKTYKPDNTRALSLQKALLKEKVIARVSEYSQGNSIELRPPLSITNQEALLILDRISNACSTIQ
ncbi:MAG: aspartate aminotransferase family protein [Formosimonas sp.]